MAYTTAEGRQELLEDLARAITQLSTAVASLGEAYELLDEQRGDTLEERLFRPAQLAYGRATRTYNEFAARYQVSAAPPPQGSGGAHSADPRAYIQRAVEALEQSDLILGELQDSMLPVEVGDPELREGLAAVRVQIGPTPGAGRDLLGMVGR